MDIIFHALADAKRRKMLDLLRETPGLTVSELDEHFTCSRFATMQHLGVLAKAELITSLKKGKFKHHYLNPVPLQYVYDRWLSDYSALWARGLTRLKYTLEEPMPTTAADVITHKQSLFIEAPVARVWAKLTTPDVVLPFFHYSILRLAEGDFREGADLIYEYEGQPHIVGTITQFEPMTQFAHTFRFADFEDAESLVTWALAEEGEGTRLELTHARLPEGSKTALGVASENGWPFIFDRLKQEVEQSAYAALIV